MKLPDLPPTEIDAEPAADVDFDTPGALWTRLRCGLADEPLEVTVTDADLMVIMLAEAVVAGAECRWFEQF